MDMLLLIVSTMSSLMYCFTVTSVPGKMAFWMFGYSLLSTIFYFRNMGIEKKPYML